MLCVPAGLQERQLQGSCTSPATAASGATSSTSGAMEVEVEGEGAPSSGAVPSAAVGNDDDDDANLCVADVADDWDDGGYGVDGMGAIWQSALHSPTSHPTIVAAFAVSLSNQSFVWHQHQTLSSHEIALPHPSLPYSPSLQCPSVLSNNVAFFT